jgi:hypothetical protein
METRKARLNIRNGRRWDVEEVNIPTDQEIMQLAHRLHSLHQAHRETIGEWVVIYTPSSPLNYQKTSVDALTRTVLDSGEVRTFVPSKFEIRSGDWLQPSWRITLAWINGDDQPPYQHRDEKNLLSPLDTIQHGLFADEASSPREPPESTPALFEGTVYQIELTAFERNPEARRRCIEHYGTRCVACAFDFGATYGAVANGIIHVHHLVPLSEIGEAYVVDPIADLNPLCPNCHTVAHLRTPPFTIAEIKVFLAAH